MERTGIEPVTFGLQSRASHHDGRQRTAMNERSQAGLLPPKGQRPAWLRRLILSRLGHEWATPPSVDQQPEPRAEQSEPKQLSGHELEREEPAGAGVASDSRIRLRGMSPIVLAAAISLGIWVLVAWLLTNVL
jgi:hypothetical protein